MGAYSLSFWDAAIIAADQATRCAVLPSEDLGDDMMFGPVTVRNPFA
jgi:predicted nucleic acid-binding protein